MRKLMATVAFGGLAVIMASTAFAADSRFPTKARTYRTFFVRAFDQCTPAGLSVVSPGLGGAFGCFAATTTTDTPPPGDPLGASMSFSRILIKRYPAAGGQGRLSFFGKGFQAGQRVKVGLTLRTTRSGLSTKNPIGSNKTVTFADVSVTCGTPNSGCFVANSRGAIAGNQLLTACLTQNGQPTGLAAENVEILSASLINCDTNKTIAIPGILN